MNRLFPSVFFLLTIYFFISKSLTKEIVKNNINSIEEKSLLDTKSEDIVNKCLKVNNAIKFNKDFLNKYEYDEKNCLKYKLIGNSILEKNRLSSYNCYKQIQKPLCKLYYLENEKKNNEECENTKDFFISLIKKCSNKNMYKDSFIHCASFNISENIIQDANIFCVSSYIRQEEIKKENSKSIYGENFNKPLIKTFNFKKEQYEDCINIVNNFNHCSIVKNNFLKLNNLNKEKNSTLENNACLNERNTNYCNMKIEKVENKNYSFDCSDFILPYLLSFQNENIQMKQLCYNIKDNYLSILKEQKNNYLKEKRKLEEEITSMRILFKSSKMIENMFNFLKNEIENSNYFLIRFFNRVEKLKNKFILQNEEYKLNFQKLNEKITKFKNVVSKFEYPTLEKNSRNENISSIKKTKVTIDNLISLEKEIIDLSKFLTEYIEKKSLSTTSNEQINNEYNYDELEKVKNKYFESKKIIYEYADKNEDSHMEYFKSQEKDFKDSINNYNNLIDIFSQQIGLFLNRNFI